MLTVSCILDAEERLANQGVTLLNANGLPNLVAWVCSVPLEGHLVPHSEIQEPFGQGGRSKVVIHPALVRDIRLESARCLDKHLVKTVDGEWAEIVKSNESLFDEDRSFPMYVEMTRI